ncbi:MAG: hypothetical protein WCI91_03475 [Candidatus Nomurabacteria bacterium]
MSNKIKIILIAIFAIIILIIGVYLYNKSRGIPVGNPNVSIYQKFNPFGSASDVISNINKNDNNTNNPTKKNGVVLQNSRFHKITEFAVSGAAYFEEKKEIPAVVDNTVITPITTTKTTKNKLVAPPVSIPNYEVTPSIRYVEKATGHIYQMNLKTRAQGEISNSTVPGVYEAIFGNGANSVIYRYPSTDNKSITSFVSSLTNKNSSFLASDITSISLSPDKNSYFSLIKNIKGVAGTVSNFNDVKTSNIFTSSFSEWLPQWVTNQSIYITTKPSYLVNGDIFNLDIQSGTLTKILGGIPGLTTLTSGDGKSFLFGASLNTGPKLNVYNINGRISIDLKIYGLPEKCVWSSDNINVYCAVPNTIIGNQFPDIWYKGLVSFDDKFVKINTNNQDIATLANSSSEIPVDATNLFLSKNEDGLFFINKKDGTLWKFDL